MAESVVSLVVETIGSVIKDEVVLQNFFGTELTRIKEEFQRIQAFLKDADAKGELEGGEQVKVWLQQLQHVAFDIEDLLEEYALQYHAQQLHVRSYGTCGIIYRIKCFLHKFLIQRHNLAARIQDIEVRLENISKGKENYKLDDLNKVATVASTSRTGRDPREDALFLDEAKVVGINENKNQLIIWLVEEQASLGVVCVFGPGGIGKTTLVRKVYETEKIKTHFSICSWITVSQSYDSNRLLIELIFATCKEEEKDLFFQLQGLEARQLKEKLNNCYKGQRYVIVMDDMWDLDAWSEIKSALPDSGCGSRIIVTTRSPDITNYCKENSGYAFELNPLSPEDSWSLFHKVASKSNVLKNNYSPDEHLREVILKFLNKCGGLSLAIVAIAGLLSTKETIDQWEKISKESDSLLSHSQLGDAAEGLCDSDVVSITKEDKAESYLDELIARCLIQVQDEDESSVRVSKCCIHDLLRDFILRKACDQEFAECLPINKPISGKLRRVSFLNAGDVAQNTLSSSLSQIRSLHIFGNTGSNTIFTFICGGRMKLLKVLHLEEFLGEDVTTNLYFLRHLRLGLCKSTSIPSSLGMLVNLETLDFSDYPIVDYVKLPDEILKLTHLRSLIGEGLILPKGIGRLTALENLKTVLKVQSWGS